MQHLQLQALFKRTETEVDIGNGSTKAVPIARIAGMSRGSDDAMFLVIVTMGCRTVVTYGCGSPLSSCLTHSLLRRTEVT